SRLRVVHCGGGKVCTRLFQLPDPPKRAGPLPQKPRSLGAGGRLDQGGQNQLQLALCGVRPATLRQKANQLLRGPNVPRLDLEQSSESRGGFGAAQLQRQLGGLAASLGTPPPRKPWPNSLQHLERLLFGAELTVEGNQLSLQFQILGPVAGALLQVAPRRLRQSHLQGQERRPTGELDAALGGDGLGVGQRDREGGLEMAEGLFGLRLGEQLHQAHPRGSELTVLGNRLNQERLFLGGSRDRLRSGKQQSCLRPRIAGKRRLARRQTRRLSRLSPFQV